MKHFKLTSRTLLGLALMGALTAAPTLTSNAQAQTSPELQTRLVGDDGNRSNLRDDDDRDNEGDGGRDSRRNRNGRNLGGRDGDPRDRSGRNFGGADRADHDRNGGRDFGGRDFGGRDFGGRDFGGRDFGGPRDGRAGRHADLSPAVAPGFIGVVTKVKNDREFDVRIGDKTYNVYLLAPSAPVSIGQTVQLNGERIGNNDIRSASLVGSRRR